MSRRKGMSSSVDLEDDLPRIERRQLPLVDLRGPGVMASSSIDLGGSAPHHRLHLGLSASASVGHGRRTRTPLTDLDSKFVTKSGFCASTDVGEGGSFRGLSGAPKITHFKSAPGAVGGRGSPSEDTLPRFPRLDQCAHFHYEYVELPPIQAKLISEELKPLSQAEDAENKSLLVQVTSMARSWVVRRTYENFRFLDRQLHRCCYDRKYSLLSELPPEENLPGDDKETAVENTIGPYLRRFSDVAGSLITCGPVLGWFELDNRGHRLIVTDDSDINTPAVAAAYVVKRYTAQASDEISFEVGDMISVIDTPPPEESIWWRGKRGFQVGFFPCECVQVIGDKVPQGIHPQTFSVPVAPLSTSPPSHPATSGKATTKPLKPVLRKHGKLIAFFRSFILSRPSRRKLKQSGILRERVFGCDLGEHLSNSGHDIPMVLKCCAEFIESHGTVDGIYRLSGVTSNIQKLRHAFDEERVPDLYGDENILKDIHCVSSVLKMYFRELPNPLLTYQLYDKFVLAVMRSEELRLLHVRDIVQQLPPPHYRTLQYLIQHLAGVASHSSDTGMTPRNIAIVWAPNLLRSKDLEKGGVAALQDVGTQAVVTEYLVRYVDLIFNDKIPLFPRPTNGVEGTPRKSRPKSLAISTPTKLISIDEARNRALSAIKSDQKYMEVGGGPQNLPKTYHTVIDLPSRKGGSLKQKKSPLGWKTLFSKNRHQRKASTPNEMLSNISVSVITESDLGEFPARKLRPVKSVESLVSTPVSAHLSRNQQQEAEVDAKNLVIDRPANERIDEKKEVFGSSPSDSGSSPSRRTHNRSISHDSYFNLFVRSSPSTTSPISSKHRNAMDRGSYSEFSPESPKIPLLDISELNLDFATSEAEMKIFSEDDTLKSTSMDDTLSRSTVDLENVSMNSDYAIRKSEEKDGKRSFKEKLKQKFTSPSLPRKETPINDSSEDSCSDSLRRASASFKDTVVQTLSPEMTRKREGNSQFSDFPPFIDTFKEAAEEEETCGIKDSKSPKEFLRDNSLEEESSRGSIESALIDAELLEKITHLRVSSSETSSLSLAEAPDNDIFSVNVEGCLPLEVYQPENWDVPAVVADTSGEGTGSIKHKSRPDSLLGNGTSMEFFPSLISPDTPQGDFVCFDIQYHPLSDTTEPSSPSESHVEGDITSVVELSQVPKQPSPLSPDLSSSSSVDDPLENCHVYENLELGSYQPLIRDFTHFEDSSAKDSSSSSLKQSPENETPPWEGQVDYENFSYGNVNKADSFGSESATPCYENCIMDFKGAESVEEVSAPSTEAEESLTYTKLNETKYCGDDDYEAMLFNEFSSLESPKKEKSDVELDGELVYQQVKYLRKSIQEVNDILRGGASYCTCGDGELTLPLKSEVTPLIDINTQSEDSECLESPVTPSSSSLVTELLVLPSFSSPTESTTEEGTSPEVLLEPQSSPRISYHLHSPSAPDSAVRSPSLQKGADLATMTLLIPSVGANSCFVPSPLPRKIPPVPKPRSLPTLHTRVPVPDESSPVTPPSNPSVSPDSPATSCTSDSSPGQLLSSDSSQPPATSLSPRSPQSQFPLLYSEERCFYDQTKPNGARSINEVFPTADVESALESSKQACLMDTIFPEPNFGLSEDSTAEKYGLGKSEDILSNNEYPKHNLGSLIESPNNSPILEFPKDATRHKPNQEHKKHIAMQSLILVPPKFYTPTPLQLESTKRCVVEQQTGGAVQPDDSKSEMEWIIQRKQDHGHPGDSNSETEKLEHPRLDVNHPDDHEFKQGMSPPDAPKSESESQKRERIEKYKEERRLFLREKYKSESFKGEKDDMMLRLKQKATSPSRMEESEGQPDSCPEVVLTDPRSSLVVDEFSAIDECTDAKPTVSHDSTIEKESHSSRRNEYLTHSSPGVLTLDEDINVKEKVAIWSRNDEGSKSIDGKPKEKPPSPMKVVSKAPTSNPVKLRKVQVNPITRMNSVPFSSSVAQSPPTSFGGKKINSVSVSKSEVFIPQLYAKNEVKLKVSDTKAKTSSKSENEGRPGRSYSVGSPPGPKVNPQPRIKDMKALFEREPHSEFAKSLPLRQTSKGGV